MPLDEFLVASAQQRYADLEAQKVQYQADLASARAVGDTQGVADAIEGIANSEARLVALATMHERYVQSQTPAPGPQYPGVELGLTPDQAEAARIAGVTPQQYVAGLWLQTGPYAKGQQGRVD